MDSDKVKFIKQASIQLLSVYLAKDDRDSDTEFLIVKAINAAELHWQVLEEKGYLESEKTEYSPVVFESDQGVKEMDEDLKKAVFNIFE